jgi:hypothetical protein
VHGQGQRPTAATGLSPPSPPFLPPPSFPLPT